MTFGRIPVAIILLIAVSSVSWIGCQKTGKQPPESSAVAKAIAAKKRRAKEAGQQQLHRVKEVEVQNDNRAQGDENDNATAFTVQTKGGQQLTRNGVTYFPGQLHKNNTLLVAIYPNDIRADYMIKKTRFVMTEDQIQVARKLAMEYDDAFKRLLAKRSEILSSADADQDIDAVIQDIDMDFADLIFEIRIRINREILSAEQQQRVKQKYATEQ